MKKLGTLLFWYSSPLLVCLLLTIIGVATGNVWLISISGFILFLICFWLFMVADRASDFFKSLLPKRRQSIRSRFHSNTNSIVLRTVDFLGRLPIQAAILIRAALLSLSFWVVSFYVSLCEGGLHAFFADWRSNLSKTLLAMVLGVYDTFRGKTISKPGLPTRILSIWGIFQFLKNLFSLFVALYSVESLRAMEDFFSTPIWFLEPLLRAKMLRFSTHLGIPSVFLLFLIFPLTGVAQSIEALASERAKEKADVKNFTIAHLAISCWLLTLPIFVIYTLVQSNYR